jgi:hypothetical protein
MGLVKCKTDSVQGLVEKYLSEYPYGWQDENGIDLSLILANLRLTPDQRVRQAQQVARQLARMLDVHVAGL